MEIVYAEIDLVDNTVLILHFNAPYTTSGGQDATGTGTTVFGTESMGFVGADDDTSIRLQTGGLSLSGGAACSLDTVTDMDFAPYVLSLPLTATQT